MTEIQNLQDADSILVEKPPARIWSSSGRILAVFFVLGLLGLLGWGLYQVQKQPLETGQAPDFTLTSFSGQTYTLSQLQGKVVIINFWASWCPPCREEAAYLEQTWRKYKDQGVIFIGVDYADAEKPALAYINEFDITYFNGPDLGTRIAQQYNIKGVPETYYVAKDGTLRGNHIGPLQAPQLDQKIDELLSDPTPSR
jgi:cytochrome c biogenesis protein CcmG/thiol:disulfide interchange protein DsbE